LGRQAAEAYEAGHRPRGRPKAALAFEKEQKRRERERAKEWKKERERRQHAVDKAQSALDAARRKHEKNAADIQTQIEVLEEMSQAKTPIGRRKGNDWKLALRRARG